MIKGLRKLPGASGKPNTTVVDRESTYQYHRNNSVKNVLTSNAIRQQKLSYSFIKTDGGFYKHKSPLAEGSGMLYSEKKN